jgi:hypothetical protein
MGAKRVILVVSHWEGVANKDNLFNAGISQIYTTDSKVILGHHDMVKVYPCGDYMK